MPCPCASGEAPGAHDIRFRGGFGNLNQSTNCSVRTATPQIEGDQLKSGEVGFWLGSAGPGPPSPRCRNFWVAMPYTWAWLLKGG